MAFFTDRPTLASYSTDEPKGTHCFVNVYETSYRLNRIADEQHQTAFEFITLRLWSIVSKHSTQVVIQNPVVQQQSIILVVDTRMFNVTQKNICWTQEINVFPFST